MPGADFMHAAQVHLHPLSHTFTNGYRHGALRVDIFSFFASMHAVQQDQERHVPHIEPNNGVKKYCKISY